MGPAIPGLMRSPPWASSTRGSMSRCRHFFGCPAPVAASAPASAVSLRALLLPAAATAPASSLSGLPLALAAALVAKTLASRPHSPGRPPLPTRSPATMPHKKMPQLLPQHQAGQRAVCVRAAAAAGRPWSPGGQPGGWVGAWAGGRGAGWAAGCMGGRAGRWAGWEVRPRLRLLVCGTRIARLPTRTSTCAAPSSRLLVLYSRGLRHRVRHVGQSPNGMRGLSQRGPTACVLACARLECAVSAADGAELCGGPGRRGL